jgi:hypothetical protein
MASDCGRLGCDTVQFCRLTSMFRRNVLPPSSHSTLKMKAVYSYDTSVTAYKTRWSQNPKDHNSNNLRRENLKTYNHAYFTI